jgi:hypothetical protein
MLADFELSLAAESNVIGLRATVARKKEALSVAEVKAGQVVYTRSTLALPSCCEGAVTIGDLAALITRVNDVRRWPDRLAGVFMGPVVDTEFVKTRKFYEDVWNRVSGQTIHAPKTPCLSYHAWEPSNPEQLVKVYGSWDALKTNAVSLLDVMRSNPGVRTIKSPEFLEDNVFNASEHPKEKNPYPPYGPKLDATNRGSLYAATMVGDERSEGGSNLLVSDGISSNTC